MGNWVMVITGTGAHHNFAKTEEWQEAQDANKLIGKLVQTLIDAGQSIESAHFTYGGREEVRPVSKIFS